MLLSAFLCFGVSLEYSNRLKGCIISSEVFEDFGSHLGLCLFDHFCEESGRVVICLSLNAVQANLVFFDCILSQAVGVEVHRRGFVFEVIDRSLLGDNFVFGFHFRGDALRLGFNQRLLRGDAELFPIFGFIVFEQLVLGWSVFCAIDESVPLFTLYDLEDCVLLQLPSAQMGEAGLLIFLGAELGIGTAALLHF